MDKLIITCAGNERVYYQDFPGVPKGAEGIAESMRAAYEEGAAVAHLHGPHGGLLGKQMAPFLDAEDWRIETRMVMDRSPVIIQHGVAAAPFEQRVKKMQLGAEKPEMISVCLTGHDYHRDGRDYYIGHVRDEIVEYAKACRQYGVKPEFEVFHLGAIWNVEWLIEKGLVDPPYWLTLFIGVRGGVWTPPTVEEVLHRVRNLPKGSIWQLAVWGGPRGTATCSVQTSLLTLAIMLGGHVRLGIEDNPYYTDGVPAQSNAQQVARIARIAADLGREVATPDEARRLIGLPLRKQ